MAEAAKTPSTPPAAPVNPLTSAVLFASEALHPGLSHVVKGDFVPGATFGLVGLFARLVFGQPGRVLVSATSFVKATQGTDLLSLVRPPGKPG